METLIRFISRRRLSVFDIASMGAIGSAWGRLGDFWLAFCLFIAWVGIGAFMDAYVKALDDPEDKG